MWWIPYENAALTTLCRYHNVACGDQSSGKSSVLEAITEIPFPRRENLCTRFATEIVLRRLPESFIATKIIPDKARQKKNRQSSKTSSSPSRILMSSPSSLKAPPRQWVSEIKIAATPSARCIQYCDMWTELPAAHSRRPSRTHPLRERLSKLGRCNIGLGTSGAIYIRTKNDYSPYHFGEE